jgi:TorA maturation chaperone TorD
LQPDQTIHPIADEDQTRAQIYALLGRLLTSAPDAALLAKIATFTGDDSEIGQALTALAATARKMDASRLGDEYQDLFIGVARGEVMPYASYYLTGFLQSKPLANLRGDMAALGIARAPGVAEPEDHVGSLCEMMAGLIAGNFDRAVDLSEQRRFFDAHIATWVPRFFADLEAAKSAVFYMPVARLGRSFIAIETQAFALIAEDQAA